MQERTKNAQFVIISLRSNMFELSNTMVGIYKVNDCTDSVAVENDCSTDCPQEPEDNNQESVRVSQSQDIRMTQSQDIMRASEIDFRMSDQGDVPGEIPADR